MNLSFAGCGFLGIYHVGVAVCFRKYAPHLLLDKISGASAGAIAACCLLCDLPIDGLQRAFIVLDGNTTFQKQSGIFSGMTSDILRLCTEARSRSLGPFSPSFNIQELLMGGLVKFLPEDAHLRVNGKLHISLTRCHDGQNVIVSHFNSREELMQALLASSFIPIFSGLLPPKFQGTRYMDGGFSNNLISLDENTITVSPFCGESDICPRDNSSQLFHINVANTSIEVSKRNLQRIYRILFPPKPEVLSDLCKQGFDDALRFLHRNNLISCTRCLSVQSTFVISESFDESLEYDPECKQCKEHQEEALLSNMPDTVLTIFQEAIDSTNKGLYNWIFKHRGMKLLSMLSLPYTLPADFLYATITKIIMPSTPANASFWDVGKFFIEQVVHLLKREDSNANESKHTAKISCQLDYTEFGNNYKPEKMIEDDSSNNRMNVCLTMDLDETDKAPMTHVLDTATNAVLNGNVINPSGYCDEGSFEQILQAASQHDAIMSYFYLDEHNKVQVTEIFDLTDSDSPAVQGVQEQEVNKQLEFDDDEWSEGQTWNPVKQATEQPMLNTDNRNIADMTLDEILNQTSASGSSLFAEPESEWSAQQLKTLDKKGVRSSQDVANTTDLPESDQDCRTMDASDVMSGDLYKIPYNVPSFNYEELDI